MAQIFSLEGIIVLMLKNINDILTLVTLVVIILVLFRAVLNMYFRNHKRSSIYQNIQLFLSYDENTDE